MSQSTEHELWGNRPAPGQQAAPLRGTTLEVKQPSKASVMALADEQSQMVKRLYLAGVLTNAEAVAEINSLRASLGLPPRADLQESK